MSMRLLHHLRANLVAYLALFAALTSSGYAATTKLVPANSVGTRQVINGSLLKKDFKSGQLPRGARGAQGIVGAAGPAGPTGPAGPAGGFTPANIVYSLNGPTAHMCAFNGGACAYGESDAQCPAGKVAIGGAWAGDAPDAPSAATVEASFPTYAAGSSLPNGWGVKMVNNDTGTASFHATAVCVG